MWTEVNKYWQVQAVLLNSQFPYGMQRFNGQISLHPTSLHTSPGCITVTVELVHLHRWNVQLEIPAASTPPARGTNTPAGTPQWMGALLTAWLQLQCFSLATHRCDSASPPSLHLPASITAWLCWLSFLLKHPSPKFPAVWLSVK